MNTLKPLFVLAVLAALTYGAYVWLSRSGGVFTWLGRPTAQQSLIDDAADGANSHDLRQLPSPQTGQASLPAPGEMPSSFAADEPGVAPITVDTGTEITPGAEGLSRYGSLRTSTGSMTVDNASIQSSYTVRADGTSTGRVATADAAATIGSGSAGRADSGPLGPSSYGEMGHLAASESLLESANNSRRIDSFLQAIEVELEAGQLADAHLALSSLYGSPDLSPAQARAVVELLDQLAGTVIYSRQHLLEPPYRVQSGETLEQIASLYSVPWQLLAKINGIRDPQSLPPGTELKVVRGPFSAVVDLNSYELTLMLGDRYAGRFPVGAGANHSRLDGIYVVRAKTLNPAYYGPNGNFAPDNPNNPLGEYWIDLGNQVGLHGTDHPEDLHRSGGQGAVCLSNTDIEDIYDILSVGSRVIIQR